MTSFSIDGDQPLEKDKIADAELESRVASHLQWLESEGYEGEKLELPTRNLIYAGLCATRIYRTPVS
jgi:hypothetical protein